MRRRRQGGYVLVIVLAAVALLAVLASRLDARVGQFRESQGAWWRWAEARASLLAARDEVLLAMLTRPLTPMGFGAAPAVLRVDGRAYRLASGVLASVQDLRGLISVATPDPGVLRNYLVQHEVPDAAVEPLLDKLADYADNDTLRRLNGAEKDDYAALGLPPPRDDWPVSPYELRRIAGWGELPALWRRAGDAFTASRENEVNPNTAPREVLLALPGALPQGVDALMARREAVHFDSVAAVAAISGIRLAPAHESFFPGRFYRIRVWLEHDGPGALEYTVMLAPGAPRLPWQTLEVRVVDRPSLPAHLSPDALARFPLALDAREAAPPGP